MKFRELSLLMGIAELFVSIAGQPAWSRGPSKNPYFQIPNETGQSFVPESFVGAELTALFLGDPTEVPQERLDWIARNKNPSQQWNTSLTQSFEATFDQQIYPEEMDTGSLAMRLELLFYYGPRGGNALDDSWRELWTKYYQQIDPKTFQSYLGALKQHMALYEKESLIRGRLVKEIYEKMLADPRGGGKIAFERRLDLLLALGSAALIDDLAPGIVSIEKEEIDLTLDELEALLKTLQFQRSIIESAKVAKSLFDRQKLDWGSVPTLGFFKRVYLTDGPWLKFLMMNFEVLKNTHPSNPKAELMPLFDLVQDPFLKKIKQDFIDENLH